VAVIEDGKSEIEKEKWKGVGLPPELGSRGSCHSQFSIFPFSFSSVLKSALSIRAVSSII
jgi:hypothetical protein